MAVTKKAAPKEDSPAAPSAAPKPNKNVNAFVRLVNGASTYVTPDREVFYNKMPDGTPRIYEVTVETMARLLTYKDDYQRRFFKQVTEPEGGATAPEDINKIAKSATQRTDLKPNDGFAEEGGELDTGRVRLDGDDDDAPVRTGDGIDV